MKQITYVTSNSYKIELAQRILQPLGIEVVQKKIYCPELQKEPISFVSKTFGFISKEKRGEYGWSFDRIFIPKGEEKTLAQFEDDERWKFWSNDAYLNLKNYLENNNF